MFKDKMEVEAFISLYFSQNSKKYGLKTKSKNSGQFNKRR